MVPRFEEARLYRLRNKPEICSGSAGLQARVKQLSMRAGFSRWGTSLRKRRETCTY